MSKKMKFIWIDDEAKRINRVDSIERYKVPSIPMTKVDFVNATGRQIEEVIKDILNKEEPDLLIIDHFLDHGIKKSMGVDISKGSAVAQIIREKWSSCPIIGITAAKKRPRIDWQRELAYDELYEFDSLTKHYSSLFVIAYYFKILLKKKPKNKDEVIELLKPPPDDTKQLFAVTPEFSLKMVSKISRWVRHTLLNKPGFLYNKLWTATFLGIKENSFDKVSRIFEDAKYKGIFADPENPKWWPTKIREILYKKIKATNLKFSWELGHKLPRITSKDYSKCYVCSKEFPEIVGYTDETYIAQKPMHLRCTDSDPNEKKDLYFKERRIMSAAE